MKRAAAMTICGCCSPEPRRLRICWSWRCRHRVRCCSRSRSMTSVCWGLSRWTNLCSGTRCATAWDGLAIGRLCSPRGAINVGRIVQAVGQGGGLFAWTLQPIADFRRSPCRHYTAPLLRKQAPAQPVLHARGHGHPHVLPPHRQPDRRPGGRAACRAGGPPRSAQLLGSSLLARPLLAAGTMDVLPHIEAGTARSSHSLIGRPRAYCWSWTSHQCPHPWVHQPGTPAEACVSALSTLAHFSPRAPLPRLGIGARGEKAAVVGKGLTEAPVGVPGHRSTRWGYWWGRVGLTVRIGSQGPRGI